MRTGKKELREFGLIMAAGLIIIFGLLFPWLGNRPITLASWPWVTAAVFVFLGLLMPGVLKVPHGIWMKIGNVLGWINSRIILGVIFFVLFTPISIILRLMGKDAMKRKIDVTIQTYRIDSTQPKTENLEKPF